MVWKGLIMQEIIEILVKRDGISELEATNIIDDCIDEMYGAVMRGNYQECEDIVASYLGLEPDYLDILLNQMC